MAEIKIKLETPRVPNYILLEKRKVGLKQDGFSPKENDKISIGDLDNETLLEIAGDWTNKLLARADEIRNSKES